MEGHSDHESSCRNTTDHRNTCMHVLVLAGASARDGFSGGRTAARNASRDRRGRGYARPGSGSQLGLPQRRSPCRLPRLGPPGRTIPLRKRSRPHQPRQSVAGCILQRRHRKRWTAARIGVLAAGVGLTGTGAYMLATGSTVTTSAACGPSVGGYGSYSVSCYASSTHWDQRKKAGVVLLGIGVPLSLAGLLVH